MCIRRLFILLPLVVCSLNSQAQLANGLQIFNRVTDLSFILHDKEGYAQYDYNKAILTIECSVSGDSIISIKVHHSLFPTTFTSIDVTRFQQYGITPMSIANNLQKETLKNALLVMEVVLFREGDILNDTNNIPEIQSEKNYYFKLAKLLKQSNVHVLPSFIEPLVIRH